MKKIIIILFFLVGCADISPRDNFSPKLQQDINNTNGRIERLENNQNSLRSEIDRISLINRENSGIQILQGDGVLILIFGIITVIFICIYFYKIAENNRKITEILIQELAELNDPEIEQKIIKAARNTEVEEKIYAMIYKKKSIS